MGVVERQRPLPGDGVWSSKSSLSLSRFQPPEGAFHQHRKQSGLVIGYDGKALLAAVDSYPPGSLARCLTKPNPFRTPRRRPDRVETVKACLLQR